MEFLFAGLSDRCQDTRLEKLGHSTNTLQAESYVGQDRERGTLPPFHNLCVLS